MNLNTYDLLSLLKLTVTTGLYN